MNIRVATTKDADLIASINIDAWQVGYKGIMSESYLNALRLADTNLQWDSALSSNDPGINIVIEYQNKVSGFCVFGPVRDKDLKCNSSGEIVALNVAPNKWRLGLGSKLLEKVTELAIKEKWNFLYLWVLKDNVRAMRFYESKGFALEGTEKINLKLTGEKLIEVRLFKKIC